MELGTRMYLYYVVPNRSVLRNLSLFFVSSHRLKANQFPSPFYHYLLYPGDIPKVFPQNKKASLKKDLQSKFLKCSLKEKTYQNQKSSPKLR